MNKVLEAIASLFLKLFPDEKETVRKEIIDFVPDAVARQRERKKRREERNSKLNTDS